MDKVGWDHGDVMTHDVMRNMDPGALPLEPHSTGGTGKTYLCPSAALGDTITQIAHTHISV